jgi:hypothetical protein
VKELHEYGSALSYEYLVREVCNELNIKGSNVEPIQMLEVYLIEDLFREGGGSNGCPATTRLLDH